MNAMPLWIVALLSIPLAAQWGSANKITSGNGAPSINRCTTQSQVGNVYARRDGGAAYTALYVCGPTGGSTYGWELYSNSGGGDVVGPAVSTDNAITRFNTTTGKLIQNSGTTLSDTGVMAFPSSGGGSVVLPVSTTMAAGELAHHTGPGKSSYDATRMQDAWDNSANIFGVIDQPNKVVALRALHQTSTPNATILGFGARVFGNPSSGTTPVIVGSEGDAWCAPSGTAVVSFCVGQFSQANPVGTGSSSVTNNIAHLIYTPVVGGIAPTNVFGLYIQPQTGGANNYGVYQDGTAFNFFGGTTFFNSVIALPASTSTMASAYLAPGVDKTTGAVEGDVWWNDASAAIKAYDGSATQTVAWVSGNLGTPSLSGRITWGTNTEGTCNSSTRGQVVMVQGGAGVADTFRICRKDASDVYAWTALY